jgi:hypothetical protein
MSDLPDEVPPVAAGDGLPLPVTQVVNQEGRRRKQRWARYALAALLVPGVVVAVAISTAAGRAPARELAGSLSAAMPGGCTEQLTLTASDGRMSGCVSYVYGPRGSVDVRGVEASFTSASGQTLPYFTFAFRNPASGKVDYQFATNTVYANAVKSHSTGPIMLGASQGIREVRPGDVLDITLHALETSGNYRYAVATISLSLNRQGLRCPLLGHSWFDNTPAC